MITVDSCKGGTGRARWEVIKAQQPNVRAVTPAACINPPYVDYNREHVPDCLNRMGLN